MNIQDLPLGRIGFGTAPLGNMFRNIPEDEALATVQAAWDQGVRYYDAAPLYGAGLAEERLGRALQGRARDQYVLSSKVGRLVLDETDPSPRPPGSLFEFGNRKRIANDYSEDGTLRSIEGSLKRLRTDRLDFVFVHDVAQDLYRDSWLEKLDSARTGAFRALARLQREGVIKGWGLGVNKVEPIEIALALEEHQPTVCLLAGRYTLLDHELALQRLMPRAAAQGVRIVVGGPYSSGILAGGSHFEYAKAPPEIVARVERIKALAARHGVGLKAAAVQFSLAHPAVAAVIPGASKPERIAEDQAALKEAIPAAFWQDMRDQGLVAPSAPLPGESA